MSWLVMSCCSENVLIFGGTYCLHLQGQRVNQARKPEAGGTAFIHTHCHENLVPKLKSLAIEETYPELLGFVLCQSSGVLEARKRNIP
jgi:hypothetical protein